MERSVFLAQIRGEKGRGLAAPCSKMRCFKVLCGEGGASTPQPGGREQRRWQPAMLALPRVLDTVPRRGEL